MPSKNKEYFKDVVHLTDDHQEYPVLCNSSMGNTTRDPNLVTCNKCAKLAFDSAQLKVNRNLRKERETVTNS